MFDLITLGMVSSFSLFILLRPLFRNNQAQTKQCGSGACDTCGACARMGEALKIPPQTQIKPKTNP